MVDAGGPGPQGRMADPLAELRHDLCAPLNQILGYSELLLEEGIPGHPTQLDDLRRIREAANAMLVMVRGRLTPDLFGGVDTSAPPAGDPAAAPLAPLTSGPGPDPLQAAASQPCSTRPGRILAVDDDAQNLDVLAKRLTRQGHLVTTAVDGEEALGKLRDQPFDLVLLDVMMPRLDGYATLAGLKADEQLRWIPVIMISALDELSSVVRCIEAGAEDYLAKPFNTTLLRARVGACLEKKFAHDRELEIHRQLVASQQRLDGELVSAQSHMASLAPSLREDPRVAPLLEAFQRMAAAVARRQNDLRATIDNLEIKINRMALRSQVSTIVADPAFSTLSDRARAMRARRRGSNP